MQSYDNALDFLQEHDRLYHDDDLVDSYSELLAYIYQKEQRHVLADIAKKPRLAEHFDY